MVCPKCRGNMTSYERNGITVEQCQDCRGLFLDRGELEHLINAEQAWAAAPAQQPQNYQPPAQYGYQKDSYQKNTYNPYYDKKRKKRSFLEDLFD